MLQWTSCSGPVASEGTVTPKLSSILSFHTAGRSLISTLDTPLCSGKSERMRECHVMELWKRRIIRSLLWRWQYRVIVTQHAINQQKQFLSSFFYMRMLINHITWCSKLTESCVANRACSSSNRRRMCNGYVTSSASTLISPGSTWGFIFVSRILV